MSATHNYNCLQYHFIFKHHLSGSYTTSVNVSTFINSQSINPYSGPHLWREVYFLQTPSSRYLVLVIAVDLVGDG